MARTRKRRRATQRAADKEFHQPDGVTLASLGAAMDEFQPCDNDDYALVMSDGLKVTGISVNEKRKTIYLSDAERGATRTVKGGSSMNRLELLLSLLVNTPAMEDENYEPPGTNDETLRYLVVFYRELEPVWALNVETLASARDEIRREGHMTPARVYDLNTGLWVSPVWEVDGWTVKRPFQSAR